MKNKLVKKQFDENIENEIIKSLKR